MIKYQKMSEEYTIVENKDQYESEICGLNIIRTDENKDEVVANTQYLSEDGLVIGTSYTEDTLEKVLIENNHDGINNEFKIFDEHHYIVYHYQTTNNKQFLYLHGSHQIMDGSKKLDIPILYPFYQFIDVLCKLIKPYKFDIERDSSQATFVCSTEELLEAYKKFIDSHSLLYDKHYLPPIQKPIEKKQKDEFDVKCPKCGIYSNMVCDNKCGTYYCPECSIDYKTNGSLGHQSLCGHETTADVNNSLFEVAHPN